MSRDDEYLYTRQKTFWIYCLNHGLRKKSPFSMDFSWIVPFCYEIWLTNRQSWTVLSENIWPGLGNWVLNLGIFKFINLSQLIKNHIWQVWGFSLFWKCALRLSKIVKTTLHKKMGSSIKDFFSKCDQIRRLKNSNTDVFLISSELLFLRTLLNGFFPTVYVK